MVRPMKTTKRCAGCETYLARNKFQSYLSANGRTMLMQNCLDCNDQGTPKRCKKCRDIKDGTAFAELVTPRCGMKSIDNTCKDCRYKYTRGYRTNGRVVKKIENAYLDPKRPPGWTPAPSAQEMSQWYTDIVAKTRAMEDRQWHKLRGRVEHAGQR